MKKLLLIIFIILLSSQVYSQLEYVPVSHPVYDYLKRMSLKEIIPDYNSASLPLSRQKISFTGNPVFVFRTIIRHRDQGSGGGGFLHFLTPNFRSYLSDPRFDPPAPSFSCKVSEP